MSLKYAWGTATMAEAVPTSAFSKGDLLVYTSASSLSRSPVITTTLDIAGIAMADSTDSINNKVPYLIPDADTVFFSQATANSQMTPGQELDLLYSAADGWVVTTSANTARVVVQRGTKDIQGQSDQSRVLVKLIRHDGKLEHS